MKKIGIIGVGKSKNIGDQLIAKCLGYKLKKNNSSVSYFDFDFGEYDIEFSHRPLDLDSYSENVHSKSSRYLRRTLKSIALNYKFDKKDLLEFISKQDFIVIGGGHLLIDNYLHFALKISSISKICLKMNIPYHFISVGVGSKLSYAWNLVINKPLKGAKSIWVRDSLSQRYLIENNQPCNGVLADPAFFSSELDSFLSNNYKEETCRSLILFIMDPNEMVRHSGIYLSREVCADWWLKLYEEAITSFDTIKIANNGSDADYYFIENYIKPKIENSKLYSENKTIIYDQVLNYSKLLELICFSSHVVAQRLHAVLPSLSMGKPTLAIKWDKKLEGILLDASAQDSLIDYSIEPSKVVEKIVCVRSECDLDVIKKKFSITIDNLLIDNHQ